MQETRLSKRIDLAFRELRKGKLISKSKVSKICKKYKVSESYLYKIAGWSDGYLRKTKKVTIDLG